MVKYDAIIVGAGPNGLSAAVRLAQAGLSVLVLEAEATIGGGCRSAELTLPGFVHDICSAIHPLAAGSPFLRSLPLQQYGLNWIQPPVALAHPFEDGTAALLQRSVARTAQTLGVDNLAYRRFMAPLAADWEQVGPLILGPLRPTLHLLPLARFGVNAIQPASLLAQARFRGERARALLAGMAAHSFLPLEQAPSAAFGLVLGILGHVVGWPFPQGGAQKIVDALAAYLRALGGEIVTGTRIDSLQQLPPACAVLFDVTPRQLLRLLGERLPSGYRNALARYRYGPGVFKVDWALDGPIPWKAEACLQAGTVHVGGSLAQIAACERAVARGQHVERPYVLVAQQSLFDSTRAPAGQHTVWAYCHVPNGSTVDMSERIAAQIERFAPGFRQRILATHTLNSIEMEQHNANTIGGDINGGVLDFGQLFTRPTQRLNPYTTPAKGIYLCSSSTPPGGGVHGMCGYWAAQAVLDRM